MLFVNYLIILILCFNMWQFPYYHNDFFISYFAKQIFGVCWLTVHLFYLEAKVEPSEICLECLDTCPSRFKCRASPGKTAEEKGVTNKLEGAGGEIKGGSLEARKSLIGVGHTHACEAYQVCQIASVYLQAMRVNSFGRGSILFCCFFFFIFFFYYYFFFCIIIIIFVKIIPF